VHFHLGQNTGYPNKFLFPQSLQANAKILTWLCLEHILWRTAHFLHFRFSQQCCGRCNYFGMWQCSLRCFEASRPSVQQWSNLEDEGATVLWNAHTMTPMTQHHIHKTWILTFQFTNHQYWYHQLYIITYCQKVNHTRKKSQKLNWNLKQFIPEEVKQLAVHDSNADTKCYEVYTYIIILQWCRADGTCSLQLPTCHSSDINSTEFDFSVSQNCKTPAQVMTNLIWI